MNKLILLITLIAPSLFSIYAIENNYSNNNSLNKCIPSQNIKDNFEPQNFPSSNNLLRSSGQNPNYKGEKIVIHGKFVDVNCVPIIDAKVYIWQVAYDGKYPYKPLRDIAKKSGIINTKSKSTFTGAGITTTNNKGEFYFVTTMPVHIGNDEPYVNLRFVHRNLGEFNTRAYIINESTSSKNEENRSYLFDNNISAKYNVQSIKIVSPEANALRSF